MEKVLYTNPMMDPESGSFALIMILVCFKRLQSTDYRVQVQSNNFLLPRSDPFESQAVSRTYPVCMPPRPSIQQAYTLGLGLSVLPNTRGLYGNLLSGPHFFNTHAIPNNFRKLPKFDRRKITRFGARD